MTFRLGETTRVREVVAVAPGNRGRALALAAHVTSLRAMINMSRLMSGNNILQIRRLSTDARLTDHSQAEAPQEVSKNLQVLQPAGRHNR